MTRVLLLKTEKASDPYIKALEENGYRGSCVAALEFQYMNIEELTERMKTPEDYSGIILTSQNSVEACVRAQRSLSEDLMKSWGTKYNYTVGEATYHKAKEMLGIDCRGADSGNAANLVNKISSDLKPEETGRFLYPKTSLKTIDLSNRLAQKGFLTHEIEVYNTLPAADFETNIADYKNRLGDAEVVVFFSPSGVQYCLQYIQLIFETQPKYIAIGPSTSEKLGASHIKEHLILESPTVESLVKCLQENL